MKRTMQRASPMRAIPAHKRHDGARSSRRSYFRHDQLPSAKSYFEAQGLKVNGGGEWKSAICPFHKDTKPSLRLRLDTGSFRCMVCGTHGGDVLAFHMQRYGLGFVEAAKA